MPGKLTYNSYGKSRVRLTKVIRNGNVHDLFELNADIQLEGDFEPAYTAGDNRNVVATDTVKNTVYVIAKENAFDSVEAFSVLLARHFLKTYPHVSAALVELTQDSWRRIDVSGKPHDHAFVDAGAHKRIAIAKLARNGQAPSITGGVRGLKVIKTTASEWRDFHTDRYRTLKDTSDRILGTTIDATWACRTDADYNKSFDAITRAMLETFATQHSLGRSRRSCI
ncbi:MAG: urate oxidase [Tepidisphaeraceae bacterium]